MNLSKLFEMQNVLDERIVKDKGLEGQDLLPQKILALQVELGELANEWRGFKFWSKDQLAREVEIIVGDSCDEEEVRYPLLEEYVDCLHFILSIGLALGFEVCAEITKEDFYGSNPLDIFGELFYRISEIDADYTHDESDVGESQYNDLITGFYELGKSLGFTWEQIEQAYIDKNAINHDRQRSGY